jgi:hypothetical protein
VVILKPELAWRGFWSVSEQRIDHSGGSLMNCCSKLFNKTLRATCLSLCLCCALHTTSLAAGASADFTSGETANVIKLESKLFNHPFDKDTPQRRIERLEQSVFGETKDGAFGDRVTALLQAVPNLDTPPKSAAPQPVASSQAGKPHRKPADEARAGNDSQTAQSDDDTMSMPGNYPAVSAIEKKILGQAHDADPVGQRLARLETQVFGKSSGSTDLSDRVDRLKQKTGVDVTKVVPAGSDWSDEEDENFGMPSPRTARQHQDNYSFGQHDMDLPYGGAPSLSEIASAAGLPTSALARMGMGRSVDPSSLSQVGLSQQITALELDILGKTYAREPMGARLNRLEAQAFPQQKPMTEMALPQRVQRLLAIDPLSPQQISQKSKPRNPDADLPDTTAGATAQTTPQKSGGLGKIISSIGNFITGGSTGGFPSGSTYVTDPRTGMMIDTISGNIIDPSTGTVIGNRGGSMYSPGYSTGLGSMGSFGNFNNGFSPFGSPYAGSPYGYGGGGSGLRFGLGGGRMGGMWP